MPIDVASSIKFTATDTEPTEDKGRIYYDDSESKLKHYDGDGWLAVSAEGYTANLAVDPTYGTGTTSSQASHGYRGFLVFDDDMDTYWASANNTNGAALPWDMEFDFDSDTIISKYALAAFGNGVGLDDWTFQGYNGSSWITLDSQTGQVSRMLNGVYVDYPIYNTSSYGKYRLNVTGSDTNTYCYFRQIAMYGPA